MAFEFLQHLNDLPLGGAAMTKEQTMADNRHSPDARTIGQIRFIIEANGIGKSLGKCPQLTAASAADILDLSDIVFGKSTGFNAPCLFT